MSFCDDYKPCEGIDGRLLINRAMDGPPLAIDEKLNLGLFPLVNASLRPFAKLVFEQRWIPKEMCYGPARSVLGLAPCENITTEVRTVQQHDFTNLVQNAMESSEVTTNTRTEGRELIDNNWNGNTIDLSKVTVGEWGSFWEVVGTFVGAVAGGPVGAVIGNWVGGAIDDATSSAGGSGGAAGGGTALGRTVTVIDESLTAIQKSQNQHLLSERTSSFSSLRERSVTRSFKNPYQNRSLELRFIPTFRHFEIITTLIRFDFGLSLDIGKVRFPPHGVGISYGDFLQTRLKDQRMMSVANAELGLEDDFHTNPRNVSLGDHLNGNPEVYAKKLLRHMHQNRDIGALQSPVFHAIRNTTKSDKEADNLQKAFSWSDIYVEGKSIFLPMAKPKLAVKKLNLTDKDAAKFHEKLKLIRPGNLHITVNKRDIHLFAGTHIEAVPGNCVLPDLPSYPKIP